MKKLLFINCCIRDESISRTNRLCHSFLDKLDKKYSVGKILESLSKCNCYQIQSNYYLFNYYDDVLNDIGTILNLDFSRKYMRLQDIKKNLGNVKK